ncbi:replication protein A 70 kDa DNA-binding subunit A-like [Cryptomeria japonica]|uniref:replication protein A 70 kDa DNA-binding subunit A-like n=1 Tax=Cryptomeria japonica TaxID=3369 RepID=UPI0025AD8439|nr:replication protein A 70 kDa DNA-binding subunit A-like [Cryptomeria japonica]
MDQAAQLTPTSNIGVENLQNSGTLSKTKVLFGVKRPQSSSGLLSIITPIKNLYPFQTRWTIKVHVTIKKEIHQYNKQTGNGRVFSFDIIDSEGTKTHVSGFNNMADAHYANRGIGATYKISGGVVKSANKIYNKLNSGIEITLVPESIVTPNQAQQSEEDMEQRYIVQIQLEDDTDRLWAIAFDEGVTQLLSMPTEMLYKLQFDSDAESDTEEVIKSILNKQHIFKLTYKKEKYNEEERLKVTITKVEKVDFNAESNILLEQIKAMHDEMEVKE